MEPDSSCPARAGIQRDVTIIVTDPAWHRLVPGAVMIATRAARAARTRADIVLGSDRMVRRLNTLHRGRNKPTNVLTYEHPAPELILAIGVIQREARAMARPVAHHLAHLIVHGALHLAGMDHDHPGDARQMEMAESRILHRIGVPNPWRRS